jgi:two-component system sensor histidine kinase SenX3
MLEDSGRLLESIEQILRTGRIGPASRKPNLSRVDLGSLVDESVARARKLYHLAPDSLTWNAGPKLTVLADQEEVLAAVSNLVDNAVKYSGNKVKVKVEMFATDARYATVRVCDQGPGIAKLELKEVFKRFHRIPGATTARVPVTGLGLYIVRNVAKRHGDRAWAESEGVGHGSTFVLQLPIAR